MNLYRSFGNLMEAWLNEEGTSPDPTTPPSATGPNFRSESVDSGVETASTDTSFPALSSFASADNAEMDAFVQEAAGLPPDSTSLSPVLSSPGPSSFSSSSLGQSPDGSPASQLNAEQALRRADSNHQKEPLTVEEVLRRHPRAKRFPSELAGGQRSESSGPRRPLHQSASLRQPSEMRRRPVSLRCDKPKSQELREEDMSGPSPGLCYLEQVCQMLEEIARQQLQNQASKMEMDAPREHAGDVQAPGRCHADREAAEEDGNVENEEQQSSSEAEGFKRKNYGHFRQRSSSETLLTNLHLREIKSDCRGQHLSTDVLHENPEEAHSQEEATEVERTKTEKSWRLKFSSFRREDPFLRDTKGQQTQSSEKNSARRRLSQLFRTRRKTLPV